MDVELEEGKQREKIRVLLVEDNPGDARLFREMMAQETNAQLEVESVDRLEKALERVKEGRIDVVLTDLLLPDSTGLETFKRLHASVPSIPVVILTGTYEEGEMALQAIQEGAQDYLTKGKTNGNLLLRTIRHAMERKRNEETLKEANAKLFRSQEELKAAQQKLVEAGKMETLGRFAAGAAHQIKNPLVILQQGADYLSKKFPASDTKTVWVLQQIKEAVERVDQVVKDLLGFARLTEFNFQFQSLLPRIEQALEAVQFQYEEAHIKVLKDYPPNLPQVRIDRVRMEQALINIFFNAIQAMPRGGELRIRVLTQTLTEPGGRVGRRKEDFFRVGETVVVVEIEDTGPGIPEEILPKVFDPFFTTRSEQGGAGLGLSMAQYILEMHQGTIEITNRGEGGARVTLILKAY